MDKVLVLAPHADDAEFGMGAYLHRMIREGLAKPKVAVFASGDYVNRAGEVVSSEARMLETAAAMGRLGVTDFVTVSAARENEFDLISRAKLIDAIDDLLAVDTYAEVFTCLASHNQDHAALFSALLAAFRPGRNMRVKRVWAYEHPGHASLYDQPALGRCYVQVDETDVAAKVSALQEHKTQFENKVPNFCSPFGAVTLAEFRGGEANGKYAELFWLVREVYA